MIRPAVINARQDLPVEPQAFQPMTNMTTKNEDKSTWAIGGTTLIGLGVGLIYLQTSVLIFIASLLIGIGAGLVITSILSAREKK